MNDPAVEITSLQKRFGSTVALDGLELHVPGGSVCGLVGRNGAGKTTTIRCMLDLLRPDAGAVRVLGLDARRDSVAVRRRVGYVAESPDLYDWMTVEEVFTFNARFFDTWDADLATHLRRQLELPAQRRLRELSHGNRAKVGLAMAIAQRPDLLLLDDPTAGLDPVTRREFFEAMIAHAQEEGQTVLFSTHLIHELERVADRVAIVDCGRTLLQDSVEALRGRTRRLQATFAGAPPAPEALVTIPDLTIRAAQARGLTLLTTRFEPAMITRIRELGATGVEVDGIDLEEIFVSLVRPPGAPTLVAIGEEE